jgi:hypothetical protein
MGYGGGKGHDEGFSVSRGREKNVGGGEGGDYTRVASPYVGGHENSDQVPLHDYGHQQQSAHVGGGGQSYEPYRHS